MENIDKNIADIVKAIAYTENGGRPKEAKAGKTGELKSTFQFTSDTWDYYSKQVSGQDNLPLTPENEAKVVYAKVADWVNQGKTPEQVLSMWNAGEHKPDAYKQNFKGINKKYGVAYDTPAYVKKGMNYLASFEKEQPQATPQPSSKAPGILSLTEKVAEKQPKPQEDVGLLTPKMKEVRQI